MDKLIEKHNIKIQIGTTISVLLFIIYSVISLTTTKNNIDKKLETTANQYEHCLKWYNSLSEEKDAIKLDNQKQDLVLVEVKTKLSNIETMLIEIKQSLKE
jgi:hypothetical protein